MVGRYILTPRIFHHLETIPPGSGGEIQLTDGIAALLAEEQVLAYRYEGTRYDCGSKLGYLQATVEFALARLVPGGVLVCKAFHGSGYSQLVDAFRQSFRVVKAIKPKASRDKSSETFLVGIGLKST